MSKSQSTEVTKWEERLAAEAKAVAKLERPQLAQISTRSGILAYGGEAIKGNKLSCVIVATVFENNLFTQPFDPKNPRNPDCYAMSLDGIGMAPHKDIENPVSTSCGVCPNMAWGSDPRPDSKGKACKEIRRMALLPAEALESPEAAKSAEIAVLRLPVTSVKNWKKYANELAGVYQRPAYSVLTTIAPQPHQRNQFEITFAMTKLVPNEILPVIYERIPQIVEILTGPYDKNPEPKEVKESKKY